MSGPDRLQSIAQQLRQGNTAATVSVRDFLSWFGAQRRRYWIVTNIRENLNHAGLRTEPDFEPAYLDAPMTFKLGSEGTADTSPPTQPIEPNETIGI